MEEYRKVAYVWNEPKALGDVPQRLRFQALDDDSMPILIEAISRVMASMDRGDQHAVNAGGAE